MRQREILHQKSKLVPCQCKCGELIKEYSKSGEKVKFKKGHHARGKNNPMFGNHHSIETKQKIAKVQLGRKHSEERRRKNGESHKGIIFSEETKLKFRLTKLGELNPMWKGDKVGYNSLHEWVRNHLPKPELCEICNLVPPYDLANISGKYLRDLTDWQYLCRKCHMESDNRLLNLIPYKKKNDL